MLGRLSEEIILLFDRIQNNWKNQWRDFISLI